MHRTNPVGLSIRPCWIVDLKDRKRSSRFSAASVFCCELFCIVKTEFDEYQRIGKGFLGKSSLWMGQDHLLYVKGAGLGLPFREEYRRFRYQDIQAFATLRTSGMWGLGTVFFIGLLINIAIAYGILAVRDPDSNFGLIWTLILPLPLGLLSLILLVRNFLLGPRCICNLQTALKTERLEPLSRLRGAEQALNQLGARIHEHQSNLTRLGGSVVPDEVSLAPMSVPNSALIAFVVSLLGGILTVVASHLDNVPIVVAMVALLLGSVITVLTGLSATLRRPCPELTRSCLWTALGTALAFAVTAPIYFGVVAFDDPAYTLDAAGPFQAFADLSSEGELIFYLVFVVIGAVLTVSSLVGLIASLKWRNRS